MKDFLSIGEMSALFGLNIQTLYYYDKAGIFKPRQRNEKNGRRKYEFDQIYELATICYMRKLGYSLEEITESRSTSHSELALASLKQRSEELHKQWQELFSIDQAIQRKLKFIEQEKQGLFTDSISVRHFEGRKYLDIGGEEMLYSHNSFYFYPTIAFYQGDKKYFGAYFYPDEKSIPDLTVPPQIKEIPAGDFLCGYHVGPYETISQAFKRIRSFGSDLTLDTLTINFNILDQFVENNTANYITHIQVRILKP